jgi:hypothetical protein
VEHAAPKSINGPDHQNVIAASNSVEGWALIAALGSADALVLIGLDDRPATVLGNPRQDEPLILRGLIVTADAEVDSRRMPLASIRRPRNHVGIITPNFFEQSARLMVGRWNGLGEP